MARSDRERSWRDRNQLLVNSKKPDLEDITRPNNNKNKNWRNKSHAAAKHVASTADTRLAMVKYRRKEAQLSQKLKEIEEAKKAELGEIHDETRKLKEQTKKLAGKQREIGLTKKEIATLREENESLEAQNEKLKKNNRNLRINNMRLEDFNSGTNRDYREKLQKHVDRKEKEHKRLATMESETIEELREAEHRLATTTDNAFSEQRLKKMYCRDAQKTIRMAEAASVNAALLLKLYDILQDVDKYEEAIDGDLPFGPVKRRDSEDCNDEHEEEEKVLKQKREGSRRKKLSNVPVKMSKSNPKRDSQESRSKSLIYCGGQTKKSNEDYSFNGNNSFSINHSPKVDERRRALPAKSKSTSLVTRGSPMVAMAAMAKKMQTDKRPTSERQRNATLAKRQEPLSDDDSASSGGWSSSDGDSRN